MADQSRLVLDVPARLDCVPGAIDKVLAEFVPENSRCIKFFLEKDDIVW